MSRVRELFEHPRKPDPRIQEPFLMPVENVFSIKGRGTIVVGKVKQGTLRRGEEVEIVGLRPVPIKTVVTTFEGFITYMEFIQPDDSFGLLLSAISKNEIERGIVLAFPGSISAHSLLRCSFRRLSLSEIDFDSKITASAFSINYPERFVGQPQINIHYRDFDCTITDVQNNPIDWIQLKPDDILELLVRVAKPIALQTGWNFAIKENLQSGNNFIGIGTITELI